MEHWRLVSVSGKELLVTGTFTDQGYEVYWTELTDGVPVSCKAWIQSCQETDFQVFCDVYNPSLEGSMDVMLDKLRNATFLPESKSTVFELTGTMDDTDRVLAITSPLSDTSSINFRWRFECTVMPSTKFGEVFLKPFFSLMSVLKEQSELLVKTIEKKDREIEEHRANGSVIKRAHLETKLFSADSFFKDSLRTPSVRTSITNPVPTLLSHSTIPDTLLSLKEASLEPIENASASSSPQKSPVKRKLGTIRIKSSTAVSAAQALTEGSKTGPVEQSPAVIVDETEMELKRRAEIEKLRKTATAKKRKTKSVF